MVDSRVAIEGVTCMHNWHLYCYKHVEIYKFCIHGFDSATCIRKHTTTGYADSFLKALNAKKTFHAHLVSTRTLCVAPAFQCETGRENAVVRVIRLTIQSVYSVAML